MSYWTGLVQGFQGRRELEDKKNFERELQNRQMSDRVFSYLLNSQDPEIQHMALSGLMNPIQRKKGVQGFLGHYEPGSQPLIESIVARINEMVPDPGSAPPPPPSGNAAMSTNQPVHAGSSPIEGTPVPQEGIVGHEIPANAGPPPDAQVTAPLITEDTGPLAGPVGPGPAPVTAMPAGPGLPPGPPQPSAFKRRGTGVPTAEEIAEMQARGQMQGRIRAATQALIQAGATPEEIESTIMGIAGAPRSQRNLSAISTWGIKMPDGHILPVLLDQNGGYKMPDGSPIPPGAQMVRMAGGGAGGGAITTKIPDSDEGRQYLLSHGVSPAEIAAGSPTGFWKLVTKSDGTVGAQADMYSPPPAFSGTTVVPDPDNPNINLRGGINREGTGVTALGDEPSAVKTETQMQAEALKEAVDNAVKILQQNPIERLGVNQARVDGIVAQLAQSAKPPLPYRTYQDMTAAIKGATPITVREREGGGTMAEKVRAAAMAERATRQQQRNAPAPPPARPARPSGGPTNPGAAPAARPPENHPRLAGEMGKK